MRSQLAIAWLAVVVPALALAAEEQPGIDLSQPPKQKAEPPAEGEELPPIDLSKPSRPPAREAQQAAPDRPRPIQPFTEKDVALGDKVKAVQRKGFLKKGRIELAPIFAATVNDAFYQKFGYGLRLAYNLQDSFAIAVRGTKYAKLRTDNVREGKLAFQSQLLNSDIDQQIMVGGVWSPIYGKASVLQSRIIHFDLFLQAGFGMVWSSTSGPPLSQGPHVAADLGGGLRFYPKDWLAFEVGMLATFYPDQPAAQLPATTQRVFVMNVGMSFFWPLGFDYVYPP
jgi:outer membrane beta-barrel protein